MFGRSVSDQSAVVAGSRLEVIRKAPAGTVGRPSLLLVHGAWHGAWCWDRGFMDRLVAAGHEVAAVSLRGHGASSGQGPVSRRTHGLSGYVADVAAAADALTSAPVVVGHSLGGLVVARYLAERRRAVAGVLMAPLPIHGVLGLTLRRLADDPLAVARVFATLSCRPVVGDQARARSLLFGPAMATVDADAVFPLLGDESFLAFLQLLRPNLDPSRVAVPLAVLSAADDAVFTAAETEATARAFGTRPVVFEGMGHDMMLEPGWPGVADWVVAWCDRLGLTTGG